MDKDLVRPGRGLALLVLIFTIIPHSYSQYFGRNKVNYRNISFEVLETPHFEFYHYLKNPVTRDRFAQNTEHWYRMHQEIFVDTFEEKNPFILYNTHADFQQTNTISGLIGVGTGGVTEALKNRVILPMMESNWQTDHVTGHELVHAFQYNLVRTSDSLSLQSLNNLPLWMVEGLAEYMSIGTEDVLTAIWLRSAVVNNSLPTLRDLTNKPDLYFPYRWGQAFWAYVTGIYGDRIIKPLFISTGRYGYQEAIRNVLGIDDKLFSERWQEAIRNVYSPVISGRSGGPLGNEIVSKRNAGEINVVPSISPDGRLLAFWTEKDIFNIDLYLADASSGSIIKKVTTGGFAAHIDEYSSYESSVAWSPDSKRLAFVAFSKGRNRLLIVDDRGKIKEEIEIPNILGFSNPTWSPDGKTIVVTGLIDGQSDLYAYSLDTKTVRQLTNDRYSDLAPSYSPDGKWIVFSTDRLSIGNKAVQHVYWHNVALYNVQTGTIRVLDFFGGANNLNPVFGNDNRTIYFLSDRDGLRNLYSVDIENNSISQHTDFATGITGITLFSPAISVSRQTGQLVYSYYTPSGDYSVFSIPVSNLRKTDVTNAGVDKRTAMLPPTDRGGSNIVQRNIENAPYPLVSPDLFVSKPYRSKFQLDYLSNGGGIGVSTGGGFGAGVAGGINGIFSDMLGEHQLYASLNVNGEVYDFGGQFAYFNQNQRLNWGAAISHIPYVSGLQGLAFDSLLINGDTVEVLNLSTDILRTFQDQVSLFTSYPFSQIKRVELGASFARYYYRLDRYSDFYTPDGFYITSMRDKLPTPKGFNFGQAYVAFVGDNSNFGVASPLTGHRFRFEAAQYYGIANMQSLLGDYRRYFRLAPVTFATRNMFAGRFGRDAESGILPPFYIGDPYFIRGYEAVDFAEDATGNELTINDLLGSRFFVTNAEIRLPLTGPERLSAIRSRFLFTELNLFTDGGIAWGKITSPSSDLKSGIIEKLDRFIVSSGISLRINFFGYLILEPYYAIPWNNGGWKNGHFGLNFIPGW